MKRLAFKNVTETYNYFFNYINSSSIKICSLIERLNFFLMFFFCPWLLLKKTGRDKYLRVFIRVRIAYIEFCVFVILVIKLPKMNLFRLDAETN